MSNNYERRFLLTKLIAHCFFMDQNQSTNGKVTIDLHQTASTKFIKTGGVKYAYRVFGKKSRIPIVLLQHFTGTMDNWDPAVTNGLARYFQVILFDNKGIGASGGKTQETIKEMAKDTIAFIKAIGFSKVNLLGFSMGGFIAQQVALDKPLLINKIILAGTGAKGSVDIAGLVNPLSESAAMSADEQKLFLFYESTSKSRASGQQSLDRIHERTINRDPDTVAASVQSQLKSILAWAQPDAEALNKLKQISQAVLVVNGSNDIIVPTINSYILFQHLPNAKLILYPDSGHGSIFQYQEMFLLEVISFLKAE